MEEMIAAIYSFAAFLAVIGIIALTIRLSFSFFMRLRVSKLSIARKDHADGIIFGEYTSHIRLFSPTHAQEHVAVISTSGAGKTRAIGLPTLNAWGGTFWALDISGDVTPNIFRPRVRYAPLDKYNHISYDPFTLIDRMTSSAERYNALCNIAQSLMPRVTAQEATQGGQWYYHTGLSIMKAALIAFYDEGYDFPEIVDKIVNSDYTTLFDTIDKTGNAEAIKYLNQLANLKPHEIASCKQTVDSAVLLFTDPILDEKIGRSSTSFGPDTIEEHSIIVQISDKYREQFAPLIELIVNQLFEYLSDRPANREKLLVFIDEFGSFKNIDIAPALEKFRKRNVRIMLLFQSLAQLDVNYSHAVRRAIMDNIAIKAILGLEDQESKEYFSQMAGSKIYMRSTSSNSGSHSSTEVKDRAIEPETFSKLHYRLIVFSHGRIFKPFKSFYRAPSGDHRSTYYDDLGNTFYLETIAKKIDDESSKK